MAHGTLREIYDDFDRKVKEAFNWIGVVNGLASDPGSPLKNEHVYFTYEYAFLKIFTAWEKFAEESFIAYMRGGQTKNCVHRTYLKKITHQHALDLLSGTLPYPDWTNFEDIYKLAKLFFVDCDAFTEPFKEIESKFVDMKKIRNAIVHMSATSIQKFQGLLRANLPSYQVDMTPGEFLSNMKGQKTFMEYYVSYLEAAARRITPI
ncbi:MAG: hypothetical protein JRJ75_16380 [Deltaproteobacteria bacterium]|nr:hypothetical protein [Deltaproteobacteria bacterium]